MIVSNELESALIPIEEQTFSEEKGPGPEFKYRYRLNLNPGTSRHLLESTHPITIANVPAAAGGVPLIAVRVKGKTRVVHEEGDHETLYLPPGEHEAGPLVEHDPWTGSDIRVYD
jgi:hypothetical protein